MIDDARQQMTTENGHWLIPIVHLMTCFSSLLFKCKTGMGLKTYVLCFNQCKNLALVKLYKGSYMGKNMGSYTEVHMKLLSKSKLHVLSQRFFDCF